MSNGHISFLIAFGCFLGEHRYIHIGEAVFKAVLMFLLMWAWMALIDRIISRANKEGSKT